jgi:hypothetical protein
MIALKNTYIKNIFKISKKFKRMTLNLKKKNENNTINNIDTPNTENIYIQIASTLNKVDDQNDKYKNILNNYGIESTNNDNLLNLINTQNAEEIKKLVEDELSEEEHGDEKEIRFRRPPHSKQELIDVFEQAEKIYEENKHILLENDIDIKTQNKNSFLEKIPKYFNIRRLVNPDTGSEIFILGVQRSSNLHAYFLNELLNKIEPDMIAVQLPPDHPMFINTYSTYQKEWDEFVTKNTDCKFLVNPLPKGLHDIILSKSKLEKLYCINFATTEDIQLGSKIIYSGQSI